MVFVTHANANSYHYKRIDITHNAYTWNFIIRLLSFFKKGLCTIPVFQDDERK